MQLRFLLLLTAAGLSLAGLSLWATSVPPGNYVSLTSPVVHQYQLGLLIHGPSPDLVVSVFGYSFVTGATVLLMRQEAPVWMLFPLLFNICIVVLGDTIRSTRKPVRTF